MQSQGQLPLETDIVVMIVSKLFVFLIIAVISSIGLTSNGLKFPTPNLDMHIRTLDDAIIEASSLKNSQLSEKFLLEKIN